MLYDSTKVGSTRVGGWFDDPLSQLLPSDKALSKMERMLPIAAGGMSLLYGGSFGMTAPSGAATGSGVTMSSILPIAAIGIAGIAAVWLISEL